MAYMWQITGIGVGTTLLGVSRQDALNRATATLWFTFVWLPVWPLVRYRIQCEWDSVGDGAFRILDREKRDWGEIVWTYVLGWLVIPGVLFGPLVVWATYISIVGRWSELLFSASLVWIAAGVVGIYLLQRLRFQPKTARVVGTKPSQSLLRQALILAAIGIAVGVVHVLHQWLQEPLQWLNALQARWLWGHYVPAVSFAILVILVPLLVLAICVVCVGLALKVTGFRNARNAEHVPPEE